MSWNCRGKRGSLSLCTVTLDWEKWSISHYGCFAFRNSPWYPIHNFSPPFWFCLYIILSGGLQTWNVTHMHTDMHTHKCQSISHGTFPPHTHKGWCRECSMWHMYINVAIRWGLVFGGACAFHVQKFCWWPYSETEVHVVEERVNVEMSGVHGINTQESHAELPKHCLIVPYLINHLQGGCRHLKLKNASCRYTSHHMFCIHSHRHVSDHKWTVHEWRLALCCTGICWALRDFCVSGISCFITGFKRI
jgi:hypothetical protein